MTPVWTVPYTALSEEAAVLKKEYTAAFERVLLSGRYIMGPELSAFEREFAEYCQSPFSIGVATGTDALFLVLRSLGLQSEDEVITAPNSFLASASSIALVGARPVFADIGPDGNIDPQSLEGAITPRTKAIIPVHLTGRPAQMPAIIEIAKKYKLFVVEDAAQAVGASLNNKKVGNWGDAACFSLHPLKNLRAIGDGGIITTKHQWLYDRLKLARNHGLVNREQCDFWSYNSRLDELQAALLRVQFCHLNSQTEKRRQLALRYNELLKPYIDVPDEKPGEYCVYQTYVVLTDCRNELKEYLNKNGVEALVHYATPIHLQPAAKKLGYSATSFPKTLQHVKRILSLPIYPNLSHEQQDYVISLIRKFFEKKN